MGTSSESQVESLHFGFFATDAPLPDSILDWLFSLVYSKIIDIVVNSKG